MRLRRKKSPSLDRNSGHNLAQTIKECPKLGAASFAFWRQQGYDRYCDQVMVIFVDEATQLTRLQARDNLSAAEAKKRIAAQMPLREKIARADVVINNNGTPAETLQQVDVWCQQQAKNAKF